MVFRTHLNSFLLTCLSCSGLNLLQCFEFCKLRTWWWFIKHDSSALNLNQMSADFSVDFIQNLFQNCCFNDSHKMRVSFLNMRCFSLTWDNIFAFIGCFGEVPLATEIILAAGEVAFIGNLNIWTVFFFCFVWLVQGYLASYFGPELQKYTSFKVHHEEIRHVTANDHGILSLSCNELCFSSRPGLRIFRLR